MVETFDLNGSSRAPESPLTFWKSDHQLVSLGQEAEAFDLT
jgi:hypothetical protein